MPEWLIGAVSKTVVGRMAHREFESHSLRLTLFYARLCRSAMSSRCVDCLNDSIERCAVTGVMLCAEHLWYADDGRRVSERVARQMRASGHEVFAPDYYLAQLGAEFPPPSLPVPAQPRIRVSPNGYDFAGWLSLLLCGTSLLCTWLAAIGSGEAWALVLIPHIACSWAAGRKAARAEHFIRTRLFAAAGHVTAWGCLLALLALGLIRNLFA